MADQWESKAVTLEKFYQLHAQSDYVQRILSDFEIESFVSSDLIVKRLILGLTYTLIARYRTLDVDVIEYPETWWDAFKIRFFPKYLRTRYPPKMVRYDIKLRYPKSMFPYGESSAHHVTKSMVYNPCEKDSA